MSDADELTRLGPGRSAAARTVRFTAQTAFWQSRSTQSVATARRGWAPNMSRPVAGRPVRRVQAAPSVFATRFRG
jgi:hypothetical protein